jgi:hypothetical protein
VNPMTAGTFAQASDHARTTAWVHSEAFHRGEPFVPVEPEQLRQFEAWVASYTHVERIGGHDDAFTTFRGWNARLAIAREVDWLSVDARYRGDFAETLRHLRLAVEYAHDPTEQRVELDRDSCWAFASGIMTALVRSGRYADAWPVLDELMCEPIGWPAPAWDGESAGPVLLFSPAGYGDQLQAARLALLVAERAGRVIFVCSPPMASLLRHALPASITVVSKGDPLPEAPASCWPQDTLPWCLRLEADMLPATPYVQADAAAVERWRARSGASSDFTVGLVWGSTQYHRSMPLSMLAPLARIPGVRLVSLQVGPAATLPAPTGMRLLQVGRKLGDWADTAAAVSALDLVVTVDTATAHLVGALGRTGVVMLPTLADWFWHDGPVTPWYPSLTLIRQQTAGDWRPVVAEAAERLVQLVSERVAA